MARQDTPAQPGEVGFDTPGPIAVTIELVVGDIRITAGERTDTVVRVDPSDASHQPDVRAAEQTRVEYSAGGLLVRGPKQRGLGLFTKVGSVDVLIELPAGSSLQADTAVAALRCVGRLGECRVKTATGDLRVEHAGPVELTTGVGAVLVDRADGDAEVSTGAGRLRLREVGGTAVVKNSNGDCWLDRVGGDLRVNAANGSISVGHAGASVTARTSNGDVRVGSVVLGAAVLETAFGEIEVGIHPGTAARLDLHTRFGRVRNDLNTVAGPTASDRTVEVRARTSYGDIVIRRSPGQEPS